MLDLSPASAHDIGSKFAGAWSQTNPTIWMDIYASDATYTDYAFGFIRRGKAGLEEHFQIWRAAHPNFKMSIVEAWPGLDLGGGLHKYSVRTSNEGTFVKDLPSIKASGKDFKFYAVVDLTVRGEDGLIVKLDEWYHRQFDAAALVERDGARL